MRRLYVELAVPDNLADGDAVELADLVLDNSVDIKRARWYPMGYDVPNALTRVGWLNPNSGVLHRAKMDTHPGPDWVPLFLYDPAQFAQVDGGEHCATLAEALATATHKVSFKLHTGERVRLVRESVDCTGETAFVLRPFGDELRSALIAHGASDEVLAALSETGVIPAP